ncbi:MAG: aminopeptidase P family protein [Anaerolineae bacterium]|nr:aminopeptidase P family protein [Anaerolineae bacterium]MDW8070846.1 aminopeptidase P family protein [Anaerolineae bacterium]
MRSIGPTEIEQRLSILRAAMANSNVDITAVAPGDMMYYLAGYASYPDERLCLLLITAHQVAMVVPALNAAEWQTHTALPLYTWADAEGPHTALRAALSSLAVAQLRRLAVDDEMRADFLLHLMEATGGPEVIPLAALGAPLRLCKSPAEIARLQAAAAQADRAMQAAIEACQPGVTEAQVAWAAEQAFRLDGADYVCFTLVASGPNSAFPHHRSGQRVLQRGDAVIIDIGASLDHYKSDITRVVHIGEPPPAFLRAYEAVLRANEAARAAVKPGVTAASIDRAARAVLEAAGYAEQFIHRTGHGLGLSVHEPPWIMAGNEQPLEEGMVFSIEPGVYFPGQFGIRIEDIVVVTASGAHTLTGLDRQLVVKA